MTVLHRYVTCGAGACVLTGAAASSALGLIPLSWIAAVTLAVLPGLVIVWIRPHSTPTWVGHGPMSTSIPAPAAVRRSMAVVLLFLGIAVAPLALGASDTGPVLSRYRSVALGDSLPAVVEALKARLTDVKVVQERPTLVQELTWRPHRYISGSTTAVDALEEMVLTFHVGRLARLAVSYDRSRIEGMTDSDLTEAFTELYGAPMLPAGSSHTAAAVPAAIGQWSDGETLATLRRGGQPHQLRFTITGLVASAALQAALADGAVLAAHEAPAKELARRAAVAAELQARDARLRRDNKAAFKP